MSSLKDQIINKVDNIYDTKQAIKRAIEDKGQTIEDDLSFYNYADKIRQITAMEGVVKLFQTEEEMHLDSTAKEGDLAIVYKSEIQNMTATTQTQYITFPETVTLSEAFTGSSSIMLRAVDESVMFDGNVRLNQTSFRFDGYSESGMIRVHYTSSDGVTYTRDEFVGDREDLTNPVDLGTTVHCEMSEEWNDVLGYFMQVNKANFGGLFEYSLFAYNTKEYARVRKYTDLDNLIIVKIPELSLPSELTDGAYIYQQIFIQTVEPIGSLTTRRKNI